MRSLLPLSLVEQTAAHLRDGFRKGHWCGLLPGLRVLAREVNVSKDTMQAALRILEQEGSLTSGGPGRRREVAVLRDHARSGRSLRVGILLSDAIDFINPHSQQLLLKLIRHIEGAGHVCFFAEKGMQQLGNKLSRITRMVAAAKADAWVVYSAPVDVIRWFSGRSVPALMLGGMTDGLPVASSHTDLAQALFAAVQELTKFGHRRIVVVSPESWRLPRPSKSAQAFFDAMAAHGHEPSAYHLPNWEGTAEGLEKLLNSLFRVTPPTAMIFVNPAICVASLAYIGRKGVSIPGDISIVSMTSGSVFDLLPQRLAHFQWPIDRHINRIVRWVERIAIGEREAEKITFSAVFHAGETIGPAKKIR